MSELFQLLGQLCSQCKRCTVVLEWKWDEITCFIPASERDIWPKELIFMGKRCLLRNKRPKQDRSESTFAQMSLCSVESSLSYIVAVFSLFFRPVGRNSPTLVILRDTCVFTLERSLSAVGTAARLSLTLQPVKLMRKLTGDSCSFNLAPLLFSTFACPMRNDRFTSRN